MKKALIEGATNNPGAPKGMEDSGIGRLPVRVRESSRYGVMSESAWKPSVEEIKILQDGGYVILSVVGWQPAVALEVVDASGAQELE